MVSVPSDVELPDADCEEEEDDDDRSVAPVSSRTRSVIRYSRAGGGDAVEWRLVYFLFLFVVKCLRLVMNGVYM
jgi:hypothetical protein